MRLYGHIAFADDLPGRALCGKPARKPGIARFYCGKCVRAAVEHHNQTRNPYVSYTFKAPIGGGEVA